MTAFWENNILALCPFARENDVMSKARNAAEELLLQAIRDTPPINWGFRINKEGWRELTITELEKLEATANQSLDTRIEIITEILNK